MRKIIPLLTLLMMGCSMDASIMDMASDLKNITDPNQKIQRSESDFVAAEIVTTSNGTVVRGAFGEISEEQVLSNGVFIEGAFYE